MSSEPVCYSPWEVMSFLPRCSMFVSFLSLGENTWENPSHGGKIYVDSQFQRLRSMTKWSYCFESVVRQLTRLGTFGKRNPIISWGTGHEKKEDLAVVPSGHAPGDLISSTRPLLTFPPPSSSTPAGGQAFNTQASGRHWPKPEYINTLVKGLQSLWGRLGKG
jgi:hypothetical protein